jgi:hypothetical protein
MRVNIIDYTILLEVLSPSRHCQCLGGGPERHFTVGVEISHNFHVKMVGYNTQNLKEDTMSKAKIRHSDAAKRRSTHLRRQPSFPMRISKYPRCTEILVTMPQCLTTLFARSLANLAAKHDMLHFCDTFICTHVRHRFNAKSIMKVRCRSALISDPSHVSPQICRAHESISQMSKNARPTGGMIATTLGMAWAGRNMTYSATTSA